MVGHTVNREIDMTRWFNNVDLRLTNSSIDNVRLTGFGKVFNEDEQMPSLANVTALETYSNTCLSQANWQPTPNTRSTTTNDCRSERHVSDRAVMASTAGGW